MEDAPWITLSEAARILGVSRTAVRQRVQRGTLPTMSDNHGRPLTRLQTESATVRNTTVRNVPIGTVAEISEPLQTVPQPSAGAPEAMPVSVVRQLLEQHQAASGAALAAIEQRHSAELARVERSHAAELARTVAAVRWERVWFCAAMATMALMVLAPVFARH